MTHVISNDHYYIGLIRVTWPDRELMIFAFKEAQTPEDPAPWKLSIRTRVYMDDKVFDSKDQKAFYTATDTDNKTADETWAQALGACERMLEAFPAAPNGEIQQIRVDGLGEAMGMALFGQPWAHMASPGTPLTDEVQLSEN